MNVTGTLYIYIYMFVNCPCTLDDDDDEQHTRGGLEEEHISQHVLKHGPVDEVERADQTWHERNEPEECTRRHKHNSEHQKQHMETEYLVLIIHRPPDEELRALNRTALLI